MKKEPRNLFVSHGIFRPLKKLPLRVIRMLKWQIGTACRSLVLSDSKVRDQVNPLHEGGANQVLVLVPLEPKGAAALDLADQAGWPPA